MWCVCGLNFVVLCFDVSRFNCFLFMMGEWFECKVRYDKLSGDGVVKRVTEAYLVDALSFTEAEKRFLEEVRVFVSGELTVTDIRRAHYVELFDTVEERADRWFRVKLAFITLDDKTGVERRTNQYVLVRACDLRDAVVRLDAGMKSSLLDYVIVSVSETSIVDVFKYKESV